MLISYVLIFFLSSFFLASSGKWLVDSLSRIAKFLGWKEFVVAFLTIALGATLPNLFVGVVSVLNGVPELSFGDVIGGNIFDISFIVGLSALISKMGLTAASRTVQTTSLFMIFVALLPLILVLDGLLSRGEGFLLLIIFFLYLFWLFGKEERFKKVYENGVEKVNFTFFLKNFFIFLGSLFLLLLAAQGIVVSAHYFADYFHLSLILIGIFIVGIGNCLPELFFSIVAAKRGEDWMILGNLIGCVMISSTLVLGLVSLLSPIKIVEIPIIILARVFLVISTLSFLLVLKTGKKISQKEGIFLVFLYLLFILIDIFLIKD